MASKSGAIRAGRAFVEIFADSASLGRGLRAASAQIKDWGAGLSSVGTKLSAIGAGLTAPIFAAAKSLAHLKDDAIKFDVKVDAADVEKAEQFVKVIGQLKVSVALLIAKNADLFGKIAAGTVAAAVAFKVVGLAVTAVGTAMSILSSGPLAVLLAAIAGGSALWLAFTDQGQAAMTRLQGLFGEIAGDARNAMAGIQAAISNGDLTSAMEIAGAGLKLTFMRIIDELKQVWGAFIDEAHILAQQAVNPFANVEGWSEELAQERESAARNRGMDVKIQQLKMQQAVDAAIKKARRPTRVDTNNDAGPVNWADPALGKLAAKTLRQTIAGVANHVQDLAGGLTKGTFDVVAKLAEGLGATQTRISQGTFNGARAESILGTNLTQQQILTAAREQISVLNRIEREIKNNQLKFQ